MDDHDLIRRLHAAADTALLAPDLDAVERGAGRARARRRWATGVAAAMLVAGAGGAGFGLGHAAGDGDQASGGEPLAPPASTAPDRLTPATTFPPPNDTAPPAAPVPSTAAPAAPDRVGGVGGVGGVTVSVAPVVIDDSMTEMSMYGTSPLTLRYTREWNGVRLRAQTGDGWDDGAVGWTPAAWCHPVGELRVTVDGADLVDVTAFGFFAEQPPDTGVRAQRGELGWADDQPLRVVAVQAAEGIAEVGVTWTDGASDSAVVENGLALLVVAGGGAWEHSYTLTASSPAADVSLPSEDVESPAAWHEACTPPPPALPGPGEQPSDVAAAEQALRDDFGRLWIELGEGSTSVHLDDSTGVAEALESVRGGGYAEAAASAVHTIEEISFTSPTEAWFRYAIETSMGRFGERYGTAELGEAGWVFPRALPCQDISLGGGTCAPNEAPIYPPSWYERNGSVTYGSCEESADGQPSVCTYCTRGADGVETCSDEPLPIEHGAVTGLASGTAVPAP